MKYPNTRMNAARTMFLDGERALTRTESIEARGTTARQLSQAGSWKYLT
jgi:hypothetical protein